MYSPSKQSRVSDLSVSSSTLVSHLPIPPTLTMDFYLDVFSKKKTDSTTGSVSPFLFLWDRRGWSRRVMDLGWYSVDCFFGPFTSKVPNKGILYLVSSSHSLLTFLWTHRRLLIIHDGIRSMSRFVKHTYTTDPSFMLIMGVKYLLRICSFKEFRHLI